MVHVSDSGFLFCIETYFPVPRANNMDYSVPGHLPFTQLQRKDTRAEHLGSTAFVGEDMVKPVDDAREAC